MHLSVVRLDFNTMLPFHEILPDGYIDIVLTQKCMQRAGFNERSFIGTELIVCGGGGVRVGLGVWVMIMI